MVNSADGDCFLCYWRYLLIRVIVVWFEKNTCVPQPQGGEMCPGSFQDL